MTTDTLISAGPVMHEDHEANVGRLLSPASIAMIGASNNMVGIGGRVFANLARAFDGPLYPINPRGGEIQGRAAFTSLAEIGKPVDMAVIALNAPLVIPAIEECARAGVGGVVILSSGFAEAGPEGQKLQTELRALLDRTGIAAIGPNCIGYMNNAGGVMANFSLASNEPMPRRGSVALVSQSGGLGSNILSKSLDAGLGLGWYLSTGNEVDLNVARSLRYLVEQPDVGVLLAFCETLRDPEIYIETARRAQELDKPMVILKTGRSDVAAAAAMSHTASVVGSAAVFDGVCRQYGVFVADSMEQMIDLALIFQGGRRSEGKRVGVLSSSGGAGVLLADEAALAGLELPELSAAEQEEWQQFLPQPFYGSLTNPIDLTAQPSAHPDANVETFRRTATSPSFDMSAMVAWAYEPHLRMIIEEYETTTKPLAILMNVPHPLLSTASVPHYTDPRRLARALGAMADFSSRSRTPAAAEFAVHKTRQAQGAKMLAAIPASEQVLMEHQGKEIFEIYGVPVTAERLVATPQEAADAAAQIGGKVVIKGMSYAIPHKSDKGAIRVGLLGEEDVSSQCTAMLADIARLAPDASLAGVLVQEMVPARMELVCGMSRDPLFGPVIALGLGGVLVEVIAQTVLLRAPFSREEAKAAIGKLCEGRLVSAHRGLNADEVEAVIDIMMGVGALAIEQPSILEIDVNPIRVDAGRAIAADALIVVDRGDHG